MVLDPDRVGTVAFDSYSTLVDVDSVEKALAERVPDPEPVSRRWRSRSLSYTFVANQVDAYRPFYEVNRAALEYALAAHGVDLPADEHEAILAVYHDLEVFDVLGARHAGMRAVRVDREGDPAEPFGGDPDLVVETIHDLADALGV